MGVSSHIEESNHPEVILALSATPEPWISSLLIASSKAMPPISVRWLRAPEELQAYLTRSARGSHVILHPRENLVWADASAFVTKEVAIPEPLQQWRRSEISSSLIMAHIYPQVVSPLNTEELVKGPAHISVGDAQVHLQNRLPNPDLEQEGLVIGVLGAGGVGTSTIATALSGCLSKLGSTLLMDLKLRGDLSFALGLDPKAGLTEYFRQVAIGHSANTRLGDFIQSVKTPALTLLPGLSHPRHVHLQEINACLDLLELARSAFAFSVNDLDIPPGTRVHGAHWRCPEHNLISESACAEADLLILVCRPGEDALFSLGKMVQCLLDSLDSLPPFVVVVNRSRQSHTSDKEMNEDIKTMLRALGLDEQLAYGILHLPSLPEMPVKDAALKLMGDLAGLAAWIPELRAAKRHPSMRPLSPVAMGAEEGLGALYDYFEALPR